MTIAIRLLRKADVEPANNFFNDIYKSSRTIADFNWEFMEGPWGPAIYVIAVDESVAGDTKIVGIQCAIPIELISSRGAVLRTAKSEDTLVHPGYRGQKIFERMYDLLFEECRKSGIRFIWGFTPARKAFERIGFEIPFKAHQALMALNPVKSYRYLSRLNPENRVVDKVKIAGLTVFSRLFSLKSFALPSSREVSFRQQNVLPADDIIRDQPPGQDLYYLNMNQDYVDWRITRNPFGNDYHIFQFFHQGEPIANAIVNFRKNGIGYLEQLLFIREPTAKHRKTVIKELLHLMKKQVHTIRALCFDTNDVLKLQEDLLMECGFTILKRGGYFVWRSLGTDDVQPTRLFLSRLFTQGNQ